MRVQTKTDKSYRYPDIVVVCGEPVFADTTPVSLKNPILIIEVLSKSTSDEDITKKAAEYRKIPSVKELVFISQTTPHIERYFRQDDINWLFTDVTGIDKQLTLKSVDCVLEVREVLRRIEFPTPDDVSQEDETAS